MQENISLNIHRYFNMTYIHCRNKLLLIRKLFLRCISGLGYSIKSPWANHISSTGRISQQSHVKKTRSLPSNEEMTNFLHKGEK